MCNTIFRIFTVKNNNKRKLARCICTAAIINVWLYWGAVSMCSDPVSFFCLSKLILYVFWRRQDYKQKKKLNINLSFEIEYTRYGTGSPLSVVIIKFFAVSRLLVFSCSLQIFMLHVIFQHVLFHTHYVHNSTEIASYEDLVCCFINVIAFNAKNLNHFM